MIDFTSYSLRDKYRLQKKIWSFIKRDNILRQVEKILSTLVDTSHVQGNSCKLLLFDYDTS
jgi:hypothetical protein